MRNDEALGKTDLLDTEKRPKPLHHDGSPVGIPEVPFIPSAVCRNHC
ncbi:unnamed protein product [Ciceribacter sp. T2.26MG-112.2]|nr:unnamed protein product [Ciceribacter naphthalenivorans]